MTHLCAVSRRLLACSLLLACVAQSTSAQSFTSNRLEQGRQLLQNANYTEAIVELNLAAIGLLDRPGQYAESKTLLFLAQVGARQRAQAKATLLLIARLEEQLSAYSESEIGVEDRLNFEQVVLREFSGEAFTQAPRFAEILRRAAERDQPAPTESPESTQDLRNQSEAAPLDPRAVEALAVRLYEQKKVADAQRAAQRLVGLEPENPNGTCVLATTRAARNRSLCGRYLPEMAACPDQLVNAFHISTRLECHMETRSYNAGRDFIASLPTATLAAAKVNGLVRKINKRADSLVEAASSTEVAAVESPTESIPAQPEVAEAPEDATRRTLMLERLEQLRAQANQAYIDRQRDQLVPVVDEIRALADANPDLPEAQRTVGDVAFLVSDWPVVIEYLERAQTLIAGSANSTFYLAVALWESGRQTEAREAMTRALDLGLKRTPHVRGYEDRMLPRSP